MPYRVEVEERVLEYLTGEERELSDTKVLVILEFLRSLKTAGDQYRDARYRPDSNVGMLVIDFAVLDGYGRIRQFFFWVDDSTADQTGELVVTRAAEF